MLRLATDSAATPSDAPLTRTHNHLIENLPRLERTRLSSLCDPFQLVPGEVLHEAGRPVQHVYFPIDGAVSLVARVDEHPDLEVGMVGRESMVGAQLTLGIEHSPLRALVQAPGACLRVSSVAFKLLLAASPALKRQQDRCLYVQWARTVTNAGCLHYHLVGPRLARWLLMNHDRAQGDSFHVTHEVASCMLGVRRVSITVAAGEFQRRGLIAYNRGDLTVLDRIGLERAACSCYAVNAAVYGSQML